MGATGTGDPRRKFARVAHAFDLDGPGPRFLQDLDPLEGADDKEIAALLIDAPGAQTLRNNADLFVKRGGAPVLSRATAAMALCTLNAYAPSGGAGHRTSLRGGGPMTTLVVADHEDYGAIIHQHGLIACSGANSGPARCRHLHRHEARKRRVVTDAGAKGCLVVPGCRIPVGIFEVFQGLPPARSNLQVGFAQLAARRQTT